MKIEKGKVASIEYTLKNDQGEVIDTNEGQDPLVYLQGFGNLIPGMENALEGRAAGDDFEVSVPAKEGYGEYQEQLVQALPRDVFQGVEKIEPGMQFQMQSDQGRAIVTVKKVEDNEITVDGNHPLAGENLNFAVKIKDVREASKEELDHGHVHGPGGHQH